MVKKNQSASQRDATLGRKTVSSNFRIPEGCDQGTACVIGPGLSKSNDAKECVRQYLETLECPIVLDADGINIVAENLDWIRGKESRMVLTPHPGEAARLLKNIKHSVLNREDTLMRLVELTQCTVVLKGAGTLISAPNESVFMLSAGNPGMATGGTGDVLAGIIGGLLAQGMLPLKAAQLGAWLHATAGDFAAWRKTQQAMTAMDVVYEMKNAWKELA